MSLLLILSVAMASSPVVAHEAVLEVGPPAGALVIRSAKTRFDLDQSRGWFTGDVKATRGDMSLTASEAEVTLGADGSITRAVARGQLLRVPLIARRRDRHHHVARLAPEERRPRLRRRCRRGGGGGSGRRGTLAPRGRLRDDGTALRACE